MDFYKDIRTALAEEASTKGATKEVINAICNAYYNGGDYSAIYESYLYKNNGGRADV